LKIDKGVIMGEAIGKNKIKEEKLKEIVRDLNEGTNIRKVKKQFDKLIREISPEEIANVEQSLINEGVPVEHVQKLCDIHVQVFDDALKKQGTSPVLPGHPVHTYRLENKELENLELIKKHYHKLQYGVFSALESVRAPTQCIQLMWHLEDSIWPQLKNCLDLLSGSQWDFNRFNKCYGKMFFLLGSLVFREDRILYPAAYQYLPEDRQKKLMLDAESYGIINEEGWRKKSDKTDRF